MTVVEFLTYLRSLDIKIWADGDQLSLNAPKGVLTPALHAELAERKAELLAFLHKANIASRSAPPPMLPVPRDGDLPLSFAQQRLWFLEQLEPGTPFYNIPAALRLTGRLSVAALKQSLDEMIRRHETLRTTFATVDDQPVQVIAPFSAMTLPVVDLRYLPESERETEVQRLATKDARRPFDLVRGPLLRTILLRLGEESHVLLVNAHHIISDGWSTGIFIQEMAVLYEAFINSQPSPLPELLIQYADFAHWQREWLQGEVLDAQLAYWKGQFGDDPPVLELPTDRPRPPVQTFHGKTLSFTLSEPLSEGLKASSRRESVTLFIPFADLKSLLKK